MAMMLEVDGVQYDGFLSLSVSRSLDELTGSFSATTTANKESLFPIKVGQKARVLIDDQPILTGFIEAIRPQAGPFDHTIEIGGRDVTGDVIDTSAFIRTFVGAVTLESVATQLIKAAGLDIGVINNSGDPLQFKATDIASAPTGASIDGFLEPYCRKLGAIKTTDGDGNFIFARAGKTIAAVVLVMRRDGENNNVLQSSASYDNSQRFNRYVVRTQQNPTAFSTADAGAVDSGDIANQEAEATDDEMRAGRGLIISMEAAGTTADAQKRADWEANIRRARAKVYTANVQGFFQTGERLWKLNELVTIDDETADIKGELLINGITYSGDLTGGTITTLQCVSPDAYTPQPSAGPGDKTSGDAFED